MVITANSITNGENTDNNNSDFELDDVVPEDTVIVAEDTTVEEDTLTDAEIEQGERDYTDDLIAVLKSSDIVGDELTPDELYQLLSDAGYFEDDNENKTADELSTQIIDALSEAELLADSGTNANTDTDDNTNNTDTSDNESDADASAEDSTSDETVTEADGDETAQQEADNTESNESSNEETTENSETVVEPDNTEVIATVAVLLTDNDLLADDEEDLLEDDESDFASSGNTGSEVDLSGSEQSVAKQNTNILEGLSVKSVAKWNTDILESLSVKSVAKWDKNALQRSLANGGQFKINRPESDLRYLIETRTKFIDLDAFKASDYFLSRPSAFLDPSVGESYKLMGDAYWDHQQLDKQLQTQLKRAEYESLYGSNDLGDVMEALYLNSEDEYTRLQDNEDIELSFGIALTQSQIDSLAEDIIWYVNETVEVDGEQHTALVPTLYLANATLDSLTLGGNAFLAANNITLNVEDQIINAGVIAADDTTSISGASIVNARGLIKGGDVNLSAEDYVLNQSGSIVADDELNVSAGQVFNVADEEDISQRRDKITTVSEGSLLQAGDLNINAGTFVNTASDIKAENATINAQEVLIGTQQNTTDLKEGGGSHYSNSQSTEHVGSNVDIAENLAINANTVDIQGSNVSAENAQIVSNELNVVATQDSQSVQMKSKSKGGWFGDDSSSSVNSSRVINNQSELNVSNNLSIKTQETVIIASQVKAKALEIETDILKLISQKDIDFLQESSDTSGILIRKITDKGYQKEEVIAATIQAENITLNGKSINDALTPQSIEDQVLRTLSSQDTLTDALKVQGIDLQSLTADNKEWDESITTLSSAGQLIVQAVVAYFTAGAGNALVAGGLEAAKQTLMQQVLAAAVQSLVRQGVSQLATAAITGNSPEFNIKSMVKGALVAGATVYASGFINADMGLAEGSFASEAANTVSSAGINTAINGGSFADNLKNSAISTVGENAAGVIGANKATLGELGHKLTHAGLGCAMASAGGGDCGAGAFGAVVGEMLAEQVGDSDLDDDTVLMLSQIGVVVLASASGLDVEDANTTATNAVQNNYLSKRQEEKFAKELKECQGVVACGLKVAEKYGVSVSQDAALGAGVVAGLGEGVYNEAKELVEVLANPSQAIEGIKALLNDPSLIVNVAQAELDEVKGLLADFEREFERAGLDGAFGAGESLGQVAGKAIALIGGTATGVGGAALGTSKAISRITKSVNKVKQIDKWSRTPKTIQDKLTLEAAKKGAGEPIIISLGDSKYKGMEKWEYKVTSKEGKQSVVHYVKDPKTGKMMDFKFKKHSTGEIP